MTDAARQSLIQGSNICTSSRSGEAQVALQAIGTGLVIGVIVGHYFWKNR
jgi:hypothetical protein